VPSLLEPQPSGRKAARRPCAGTGGPTRMTPAPRMRSTTLSLIISSLDEGAELHETLRSVFAGSVVPVETIVVDDGGTDGSCAALERDEWRAQGVIVHRIERSGIAAARNVGGRLAKGPHLAFLDAHCRLEPDCLARLDAALIAQPDAILAPAVWTLAARCMAAEPA
jgi:glycosyltransferase involved in cell wall biosynthesis